MDDRQPKQETPPETPETPPTGYGHPAHRPDPDAHYGFEPGKPRVLPVDPKRRWRVTG